jgi:excisionase family DNA binding protein
MDLHARLAAIVAAMPPGSTVSLPVDWLRTQLDEATATELCAVAGGDLTIAEVAERLKRRPGTVRGWVRQGVLQAYSFRGREYRITEVALASFVERERQGATGARHLLARPQAADLGAWRRIRQEQGSGQG